MKKTISLIMLYSMLVMTYTGIMLFIAPQGKVAYWVDWTMLGMNKAQFGNLHITFMFLFIFATIFHVYYNWKPLTSYMKDKVKQFIFFTKENIIALLVTTLFIVGTLTTVHPFKFILDLNDDIKHYWADTLGKPPYGHAELSSFKTFCKRMGYDMDEALEVLKENGIKVENSRDSLQKIAKYNNITPAKIYDTIFEELL